MTLACAYRHIIETAAPHTVETAVGPDLAKTVITARVEPGQMIRAVKLVSYHHVDRGAGRGARRSLPPHA